MNEVKKTDSPHLVIIGFGNQAKAWALNLRDSGWEIKIALRQDSPSLAKAQELGFSSIILSSDMTSPFPFQNFALLTPDHTHLSLLQEYSALIPAQAKLISAHGLSNRKNAQWQLFPQWSHLLFAPKSIASELRFLYQTKGKIAAVYSVEHSPTPEKAKENEAFLFSLAQGLGINVGPYLTTFAHETYADLFSEQSLLCSLLPYASLICYNMLVERGIEKELAFLECWHELKLIADTMVTMGPEKFFDLISPNALVGGQKGKALLLDGHFQKQLRVLVNDIFQERFFKETDNVDYGKLRNEVKEFWRKEDFSQTFNRMAKLLYQT